MSPLVTSVTTAQNVLRTNPIGGFFTFVKLSVKFPFISLYSVHDTGPLKVQLYAFIPRTFLLFQLRSIRPSETMEMTTISGFVKVIESGKCTLWSFPFSYIWPMGFMHSLRACVMSFYENHGEDFIFVFSIVVTKIWIHVPSRNCWREDRFRFTKRSGFSMWSQDILIGLYFRRKSFAVKFSVFVIFKSRMVSSVCGRNEILGKSVSTTSPRIYEIENIYSRTFDFFS